MPKTAPFEENGDRYESWFERHPATYNSELAAVNALWPAGAQGVEIGVGAAHFAAPLGIRHGVEPSPNMRRRAVARGIDAVDGIAERLPFPDGRFEAALMVTTLCFVDDPEQSIREMFRVLRPGGCAVIGFLDRDTPLGREYEQKRTSSVFFRNAQFFSTAEVAALMVGAGFAHLEYRQTLFTHPDRILEPDPVRNGSGDGLFVVLRGCKTESS